MKRQNKLTRAIKRAKFKTVANWLREKAEAQRKEEARKLNEAFKD